ncbi:unnamed protein product [Echinostoma caproni]|uniref:CCDC92 domain-containing protein n=1 Tax=Echinostoma caproni TaxID=27848 RepID=A0A183AUX1_9TREM|nr:unnamed protein product [Echinostoma caproni]
MAKGEAERARSLINWKTQPADCLVLSLTQTEKQLRDCQVELDKAHTELTKLHCERDQLQLERDTLAQDLEHILNRRQNFADLRQQLTRLTQEKSGTHNKCSACVRPTHRDDSLNRHCAKRAQHSSRSGGECYYRLPHKSNSGPRVGHSNLKRTHTIDLAAR